MSLHLTDLPFLCWSAIAPMVPASTEAVAAAWWGGNGLGTVLPPLLGELETPRQEPPAPVGNRGAVGTVVFRDTGHCLHFILLGLCALCRDSCLQ